MMIPSIDLAGGRTVQLVGGEEPALEAGDPRPLAERYGRVGEIAVIDLDAAKGEGRNADLVADLLQRADCRVGGGIRDADTALQWLRRGAAKVILGTAATPEVLRRLPPERVIVALDARDGEVVVEGWRTRTGVTVEQRLEELRGLADTFLVTFVEREGRMVGLDLDRVQRLVELAAPARLCVAGGVACAADVAALDALGADVQVGMALYTGRLGLADTLTACLRIERDDGLIPTLVCDDAHRALGLVWSNQESLTLALDEGRGVYWSRRRGLWRKGESSGHWQQLLRVEPDCDRDALRVTVRQRGPGFCHTGTRSCFGDALRGSAALEQTLTRRREAAPDGSFTARLLSDPAFLREKLVEEAGELADADVRTRSDVVHEGADVLYFTLVALARAGVRLAEVERELDRRAAAPHVRVAETLP